MWVNNEHFARGRKMLINRRRRECAMHFRSQMGWIHVFPWRIRTNINDTKRERIEAREEEDNNTEATSLTWWPLLNCIQFAAIGRYPLRWCTISSFRYPYGKTESRFLSNDFTFIARFVDAQSTHCVIWQQPVIGRLTFEDKLSILAHQHQFSFCQLHADVHRINRI